MGVFNTSKTIETKLTDVKQVLADAKAHFEGNCFTVQAEETIDGGFVSITKGGFFKSVLGMKTALNTTLKFQSESIFVESKIGSFGDKAITAAGTWFVAWPLAVTAAIGMVGQAKLDEEMITTIEESIRKHENDTLSRTVHGTSATQFCTAAAQKFPRTLCSARNAARKCRKKYYCNSKEKQIMENQDYRFYAFISYNHKNEKWAKWLQKKLEAYRLPTVLQKQYRELPKKLKIFRDKTDLSAGNTVKDALARALAKSKKLIVICSPNVVKDDGEVNWVDYEIQQFQELGHTKADILTFVIDGEIEKNSEYDCYTEVLHKIEPLAASIQQDGKKDAFLRLVAGLLGLDFDDLKRREHIRTVRRNTPIGTVATVAFAFVCAFTWYITPHTKYYADYVTRWGVSEGIGKINKKDAAKNEHYAITYKCLRPILLRNENSMFELIPEETSNERQNRPKEAHFQYEHGFSPFLQKKYWNLQKVLCTIKPNNAESLQDHSMQIVYEHSVQDNSSVVANFFYGADTRIAKNLSNDILSYQNIYYNDYPLLKGVEEEIFNSASNICRHKIFYDENGFETRILFIIKMTSRLPIKTEYMV